MDYRVEILHFPPNGNAVVVATLEWKYRTLEEAQDAGRREVVLTADTDNANGYRILDESGREVTTWHLY